MKCVNSAWLQKYLFREDHGWLKKKKGRWGGTLKVPLQHFSSVILCWVVNHLLPVRARGQRYNSKSRNCSH